LWIKRKEITEWSCYVIPPDKFNADDYDVLCEGRNLESEACVAVLEWDRMKIATRVIAKFSTVCVAFRAERLIF